MPAQAALRLASARAHHDPATRSIKLRREPALAANEAQRGSAGRASNSGAAPAVRQLTASKGPGRRLPVPVEAVGAGCSEARGPGDVHWQRGERNGQGAEAAPPCAEAEHKRPVHRRRKHAMRRRPLAVLRRARRAVTGTSVLARAQSPPRASAVHRTQPRSVRPGAGAQRRNSSDGRGGSLGGRCGRMRHSARRRSALWRTRAAAAHIGAHACAGTCYACIRHAGRRRSAQCAWGTQRCEATGVLREYCEYPGTAGVRALQLGGARARRPLLRARLCAGARVPGCGCLRCRALCARNVMQHCSPRARLRCKCALGGAVVSIRDCRYGRTACVRARGRGRRVRGRSAPGSPAG
jgi:hypothetical protein